MPVMATESSLTVEGSPVHQNMALLPTLKTKYLFGAKNKELRFTLTLRPIP